MDKNNRLMIEDNNSKFGTLNLIKELLPLDEEKNFIQVGRSTFEIYAAKKWFSSLSCMSISNYFNNIISFLIKKYVLKQKKKVNVSKKKQFNAF